MDLGDGQFIYHCPEGRHTEEEIRKAINSVPEFCNGKLKEVSREENLQMTDGQIEIVFQCQNCKKEPMAIFEFEGYYDEDDNLIEGFL